MFTVWNYFEKKLTLMIYGKYIDIDKHIESHEKELQNITESKTSVDRELSDLVQAELEIKKILEETTGNNSGQPV